MIKIDVLTLFPGMFEGPLTESMLKRAREKKLIEINIHNIRDFAEGKHKITDDSAYGSGGMVLKPEPIYKAVESLRTMYNVPSTVVLMTPDGKVFDQETAKKLSKKKHLIFICGHYEGVDERVRKIADEEISIGDYVLTGGELPAMVCIDAVARMIEGVVGRQGAVEEESFYKKILDCPHYTRPRVFRKMKVPDVLLSGDHKKIAQWRAEKALQRTKKYRPDLLREIKNFPKGSLRDKIKKNKK